MTNVIQFPNLEVTSERVPTHTIYPRVWSDDPDHDPDYDGTYVYVFSSGDIGKPQIHTYEIQAPDEWSAYCGVIDCFERYNNRLVKCGTKESWFTYSVHFDEYEDDGRVPVKWDDHLMEVTLKYATGRTPSDIVTELISLPPKN